MSTEQQVEDQQDQQDQGQDEDQDSDDEGGDDSESVNTSIGIINTAPVNLEQQIDEPVTSGSDGY
jgi:hypothetical protein